VPLAGSDDASACGGAVVSSSNRKSKPSRSVTWGSSRTYVSGLGTGELGRKEMAAAAMPMAAMPPSGREKRSVGNIFGAITTPRWGYALRLPERGGGSHHRLLTRGSQRREEGRGKRERRRTTNRGSCETVNACPTRGTWLVGSFLN